MKMSSVNGGAWLLLTTSICAIATASHASETTTYQYDTLGRLVAVTSTGSANGSPATSINYDPAGNRSGYAVTGAAGTAAAAPAPGIDESFAASDLAGGAAPADSAATEPEAGRDYPVLTSNARGAAAAGMPPVIAR